MAFTAHHKLGEGNLTHKQGKHGQQGLWKDVSQFLHERGEATSDRDEGKKELYKQIKGCIGNIMLSLEPEQKSNYPYQDSTNISLG